MGGLLSGPSLPGNSELCFRRVGAAAGQDASTEQGSAHKEMSSKEERNKHDVYLQQNKNAMLVLRIAPRIQTKHGLNYITTQH